MTVDEYTRIKEKIASAKEQKSRLQGSIDRIYEQLEKDWDIHSKEEAEEIIASLEEENTKDKDRQSTLIKKQEGLS